MKLAKSFSLVVAALGTAGLPCLSATAPKAVATSPDGRNAIRLWTSPLAYDVTRDGIVVVGKTPIGMTVNGRALASGDTCAVTQKPLAGTLATPFYKKDRIDLAGNETRAAFGNWAVRMVARDDGVAYRLELQMDGRVRVDAEQAGITIPDPNAPCALNYGVNFGCEETVPAPCKADAIATGAGDRRYVYLPFAYEVAGKHVAVTESDVCDYPVWNLKRVTGETGVAFGAVFAGWPLEQYHAANDAAWKSAEVPSGGRWVKVRKHADWLVETDGTRTFPWRTFVLADAPSKFCEADIVMALAREAKMADFSWVRPGKVAWDWWNAWDNKGETNGCTTAGYKRFIDFASKSGVEYVILDEGWSEKLNIWKFHPNVDVPELIRYGREKNVGIILWMAWAQIVGDEERVASHFAALGAKGFKVDFMDRGDADCERFLWKFADACARNRAMVDYHGAHRPTGMSRTYPNVVNYEGVHGLENAKWFKNEYDFPDNDVKQFFLRMTAGPMDYTPGAMDNYPVGQLPGTYENPGSVGTRCRQMAMMAAYEAPLQMLCDAPTKYERNAECFAFMARTPVVWKRTAGLGGTPDTFAAVARQADDGTWYAAAINGSAARDFALDTAFLGAGEWAVESFRDADDADRQPTHYVHASGKVRAGEKMPVRMAPGGGFVMRFTPPKSGTR